jgi:hypothetical protein
VCQFLYFCTSNSEYAEYLRCLQSNFKCHMSWHWGLCYLLPYTRLTAYLRMPHALCLTAYPRRLPPQKRAT